MEIKVGEFTVECDEGTIKVYDSHNNMIHHKDSKGYEWWKKYDINNNLLEYKDSEGYKEWFNPEGARISEHEYNMMMLPVVIKANQQ